MCNLKQSKNYFHAIHRVLQIRRLRWVAISFSSGSHFFKLHCDLSWVVLHGMAHNFTELRKSLCHDKGQSMKGILKEINPEYSLEDYVEAEAPIL